MDTKIICPTNFKTILRPLHPTFQDKTRATMLPRLCPTRPCEYQGRWSRFQYWSNNFSFSKKTSKPMEEGGSSFQKNIFLDFAGTWLLFLKSEKRHIEVIPHHHTITGTRGEVQGRWGGVWRWVEVIWVEGRVRGELAPFLFIFPSHLPFLGFPLTTSL